MSNQNPQSEVLFQKLGNTWYCFTEVKEDIIYSALPEGINPKTTSLELYEVIEEHMAKVVEHYKGTQSAA